MTLDDLTLPDSLVWTDEFNFNQMAQETERSLTGGLLVQEGAKQFGRPITLSENWLDRATLDALVTKEGLATTPMTLVLADGREFAVIFDRTRGPAIEATPVHRLATAANVPTWKYQVTLRLLTVEPPPEPEE